MRPDLVTLEDNKGLDEVSFKTSTALICLPNSIMIYLKRGITRDGINVKVESPIQLDPNHQIGLTLYEPQYSRVGNHQIPTSLVPRATQLYRIGAAVTHIGSNMGRGHYVCYERTQNGQRLIHDDSTVKTDISEADFGIQGYFLRLDKI